MNCQLQAFFDMSYIFRYMVHKHHRWRLVDVASNEVRKPEFRLSKRGGGEEEERQLIRIKRSLCKKVIFKNFISYVAFVWHYALSPGVLEDENRNRNHLESYFTEAGGWKGSTSGWCREKVRVHHKVMSIEWTRWRRARTPGVELRKKR